MSNIAAAGAVDGEFYRIGLRPCRRPRDNRENRAARAVDRESDRAYIREKSDFSDIRGKIEF